MNLLTVFFQAPAAGPDGSLTISLSFMSVPIFFLKSSILLGLFIIGFKIGYFF